MAPIRKILMVNRPEAFSLPGGDTVQMLATKAALESRGVEVVVSLAEEPDGIGSYDAIHVFNLQNPEIQLRQVHSLRKAGVPIALSTIFWDHKEFDWARQVIRGAFSGTPEARATLLAGLANRDVVVGGQAWNTPVAGSEAYQAAQEEVVRSVDLLLPNSHAEAQNLFSSLDIPPVPYHVVPNGLDPAVFAQADPAPFVAKYGVRDFVLVAARWDDRKNLALLAAALAGTGLPLVLAGNRPFPDYEGLVRSLLPPDALVIDHLDHAMLASAYAAARVHALPSWFETPGLANLEAAVAGCALVTGDRAAEREYFGDAAYYADPANVVGIRRAVLAAWENHAADAPRREALRAKILAEYTWDKAAEATLEAYARLQAGRGPILPRADVTIRVSGGIPAIPAKRAFAVSIVIPCWNRVDMTQRCLEALAANTPEDLDYEVVLIDNGSTDGTAEFLADLDGDCRVIRNDENLGFARACNQGAEAARGEVLVFLNNDTMPRPGWLEALLAALGDVPRTAIAGAKLIFPDGRIQHAGVTLGLEACPFHWLYKAEDSAIVNQERDFQAVTAACMAISRERFEELGGFDEGFANGYEDVDLCLKARARGYRVRYTPSSVVLHEEGASFGRKEAETRNWERLKERWAAKLLPDNPRYEAMITGSAATYSVIVVSYNSESTLATCLASVLGTLGRTDEVIVVDNASRDRSVEIAEAFGERDSRVRVMKSPRNLGFSEGANVGMRAATGEYLVLLNPDTVVTPEWLERMRAQFRGDPLVSRVGAVGPTSAWVAGKQKVQYYVPDERLSGLNTHEIHALLPEKSLGVEAPLLIGFCMMLPRIVLEEIGPLDKDLFLGMDDLDICWRLKLAGYRLMVATNVYVGHEGQVSFKSEPAGRIRRLSRESANVLARKLEAHYGRGRVPTSTELWGMSWYCPDLDLWGPAPTVFGLDATRGGWEEPVDAYLAAFEPADPVSLRIYGEDAGVLGDLVGARILAAGRDLEQIPDIEVLPAGSRQDAGAPGAAAADVVMIGPGAPAEAPHLPAATPEILRRACGFRPETSAESASIVILTRNTLWCTELCLYAIERYTREEHEVIIVDNASTDGTREFLRDYARNRPHVTLVFNETNAGFAAGCNQGIAAARCDHIVLLNNDVVVTDGWLSRLLRPLRDPAVGIVGPRTNCVAGTQLVKEVPYDTGSLQGLQPFAISWARRHAGRGSFDDVAIGFCMLIRGEVVRQIGGLDPRFGTGNFEDDDYCLRAQIAGYRVFVADDCFVHHFGSQTFQSERKRASLDYSELMEKNKKFFMDKWGVWLDQAGKPKLTAMLVHYAQVGRCFDLEELHVPLPAPADLRFEATPVGVDGLRERNLLIAPDWEDPAWEAVVTAFAAAFDAASPVALVVPRPPRVALERLEDLLAGDATPDVLVMEEDFLLADLIATVQGVALSGDACDPVVGHLARLLGRPALERPDEPALRAWASGTGESCSEPGPRGSESRAGCVPPNTAVREAGQ
ncbi:MAG: glycosyltransferase [Candidatus Sericytochromatia bacterium]|nr:glycosyltransferase [Candidatus Tanganyikabacteria bacterium]